MASGGIVSLLFAASLYVTVSCSNPFPYLSAGTTTTRAEDTASIMIRENPKCNIDCRTAEKQYFCASNGRTLDSQCKVDRALCKDSMLEFKPGKCEDSRRCQQERNHTLKIQSKVNGPVHIPACEPDGTYSKVQCDPYLGWCWCITSLGKIIRNSTVKLGITPPCARTNSKRRPRCKTLPERVDFARRLRDLIVQEYNRKSPSAERRRPVMIRSSAIWEHMTSDKNGDEKLSQKEIKKLLKPYRKRIPRPCKKVLLKHCDQDNNKKVSMDEWLMCLGAPPKVAEVIKRPPRNKPPNLTETTEPQINTLSRASPGTTNVAGTAPQRPHTCREARNAILREKNKNVNVPKCEGPNFKYWSPVQCHNKTGYCWCVVRENGRHISQTSVDHGTPNCEESESYNVPIPDCPTKLKAKFLRGVHNLLISKMSQVKNIHSSPHTEKMSAARYCFDLLDANHDGVWSHSESKKFKKLLSGQKLPKKCLRKFTRHCDRDNNKKTTKNELIACLEVTRQDRLPKKSAISGTINQLKTTEDPEY